MSTQSDYHCPEWRLSDRRQLTVGNCRESQNTRGQRVAPECGMLLCTL